MSKDVYSRLGIGRVINASGRMTNLIAGHTGEGYVAVDPRPIDDNDARMIVERIREWASI